MRFFYYCVTATLLVSSCVDDNYDLSNIDTTTRINVNDLTIPVNIDKIELSSIIDCDDDSPIHPVTIDGTEVYALTESGNFSSQSIFIRNVDAAAPSLSPTQETLSSITSAQSKATGFNPSSNAYTYDIVRMGNDFNYKATDIDSSIDALYSAAIDPLNFSIKLNALNTENAADRMYFTDLVINLPKGLTATTSVGSYDKENGVWSIPFFEVEGNKGNAMLTATAVDFLANGWQIEDRTLNIDGCFRVMSGTLTIEPLIVGGVPAILPDNLEFRVDYSLDDFHIRSLSGMINYQLAGMDISPISLNDIPDFLSDEGTNISLDNPQIYLRVNNPVADNGLDLRTGLTLTAIRDNAPARDYSIDNRWLTVGHNRGTAGPYCFVLSPSDKGLAVPEGFKDNLKHEPFSDLGQLLSSGGNADGGMPNQIGIHLDSPMIPSQTVSNFELGRYIDGIEGAYELMAPLALGAGSTIVYTGTEDGWNDEDVDAIVISTLSADCKVTNGCPMDIVLSAVPLDKNGKEIEGVIIESNTVKAGASDTPMTIVMKGEIRHLDGIRYTARVIADGSTLPLSPEQSITLTNVRMTVSGYYEKEF